MSFQTEIVKDGRLVAYKLDISFDNFNTISYRYSTIADVDATNVYDPRILKVGRLSRGLGNDNYIQASTIDLLLDNTDQGADWLNAIGSASDWVSARMKLYIYVADPNNPGPTQSTTQVQQLGIFSFSEPPFRDEAFITCHLADDTLGYLEQVVVSPTIADVWNNSPTNIPTASNPLRNLANYYGQPAEMQNNGSWHQPLPVAFGENAVECLLPTVWTVQGSTLSNNMLPCFFCASLTTVANQAQTVIGVWVQFNSSVPGTNPNTWYLIPQTIPDGSQYGSGKTIWTTQTLGKATTTQHLYVGTTTSPDWTAYVLGIDLYELGFYMQDFLNGWQSGAGQADHLNNMIAAIGGQGLLSNPPGPAQNTGIARVAVLAYPFSAITNPSSFYQHPADVLTDILQSYSCAAPAVNTSSISRYKSAFPDHRCAGVINGEVRANSQDPLRVIISDLAASFGFDIYSNWSGQVSVSDQYRDFTAQTQTFNLYDETRMKSGFSDSYAKDQERHCPINRLFLAKTWNERRDDVPPLVNPILPGPYDNPKPPSWGGRIFQKTWSYRWVPHSYQAYPPWAFLKIQSELRPIITFTTDIWGLQNDIGDFIQVTWTRNVGGPYNADTFQIESIEYDPETTWVKFTCVYAGALYGSAYLLDDETLENRTNAGGTATLTFNSNTVNFSTSQVSQGWQVGDDLILQDTTEAAANFKRNQVCRIEQIISGTQINVSTEDGTLDWGLSSGSIAVAAGQWSVRRSHVTYKTQGTDGANYPNGSNMYGCVANSSGVYSAAGTRGFTAGLILGKGG